MGFPLGFPIPCTSLVQCRYVRRSKRTRTSLGDQFFFVAGPRHSNNHASSAIHDFEPTVSEFMKTHLLIVAPSDCCFYTVLQMMMMMMMCNDLMCT